MCAEEGLKVDKSMGKLLENSEVSSTGITAGFIDDNRLSGALLAFWRAFFRVLVVSIHAGWWREPSVSRDIAVSETELGKLRVERGNALVGGSLSASLGLLGLNGVEGSGLDLSLLFEGLNTVSLGPASEGGEITERAELPGGLKAESAESVWHNHALLLVVREGHAFEDLQLTESGGASG